MSAPSVTASTACRATAWSATATASVAPSAAAERPAVSTMDPAAVHVGHANTCRPYSAWTSIPWAAAACSKPVLVLEGSSKQSCLAEATAAEPAVLMDVCNTNGRQYETSFVCPCHDLDC